MTVTRRRKKTDAIPKPTSESERALLLRTRLGLIQSDFARMLAISIRTLAAIEAGHEPNAATLRRIAETERIVDALGEVMKVAFIGEWMNSPNSAFQGLKPLEVIERGETDRIWQMIFELRSGVPG